MTAQTLSIRLVPADHPTFHNLRAAKLIREATGLGLKDATRVCINAAGAEWVELKRDDGQTPWIERLKKEFEALGVETRMSEPSAD